MLYILEYDKKNRRHSYILETEFFDNYEDANLKYILLDNSLISEIPYSDEFNKYIAEQSEKGLGLLDSEGKKTKDFYNIVNSYYETKPYKQIRKKKLLKMLSDSDWKVTVNYELIAAGMEPKYDTISLHRDRQSWRDEINLIESTEDL